MARILFKGGALDGQTVKLPESGIKIGRRNTCNLVIPDGAVSGEHLTLTLENGKWWAKDLGSSNGTMVNGSEISGKTAIKNGDELMLGDSRLTLTVQE